MSKKGCGFESHNFLKNTPFQLSPKLIDSGLSIQWNVDNSEWITEFITLSAEAS